MHLVGFTIEIYYDARPYERQTSSVNMFRWYRLTLLKRLPLLLDCGTRYFHWS